MLALPVRARAATPSTLNAEYPTSDSSAHAAARIASSRAAPRRRWATGTAPGVGPASGTTDGALDISLSYPFVMIRLAPKFT